MKLSDFPDQEVIATFKPVFTALFIEYTTDDDDRNIRSILSRARDLSQSDWVGVAVKLLEEKFGGIADSHWRLEDHGPSPWEFACIQAGIDSIDWEYLAKNYESISE